MQIQKSLTTALILVALGASTLNAATWVQSTTSDFAVGSSDGQLDRTSTGGGALQLAKKAGSLGSWSTLSAFPSAIDQQASFATEDALYIIAGLEKPGATELQRNQIMRASVDASGNLGAWTSVGTISNPRAGLALARWADHLYMGGGFIQGTLTPVSELTSMTIASDGSLSASLTQTALPYSAGTPRLFAMKGRLYLVNETTSALWSAPLRADGQVGTWVVETGGTVPYLPANTIASFLGDHFLLYGHNASAATSVLFISDAASNAAGTWAAAGNLPTQKLDGVGSGPGSGGKFYQMGGETSGVTVASVYSADASANGGVTWTTEVSLPAARRMGSLLFAKGYAYYVGGWDGSNYQSTVYRSSLNQGVSNAAVGSFVGRFDVGSAQSIDHLEWDASYPSSVKAQARSAGSNGVFGPWTSLSSGYLPLNVSLTQYVEYRLELSDPGSGNTQEVTEVRLSSSPLATATPTPAPTTGPCSVNPSVPVPYLGTGQPGDILITASGSGYVLRFDATAHTFSLMASVQSSTNIDGILPDFTDPSHFKVLVEGSGQVESFDAFGNSLGSYGTAASGPGLEQGSFAPDGTLWMARRNPDRLVKFPAGGGAGVDVLLNGFTLNAPDQVAFDLSGNLFVTDTLNNRVLRVAAANVNTASPNATVFASSTGATGLAFDGDHTFYLLDQIGGGSNVVKMDSVTGVVTPWVSDYGSLGINAANGGILFQGHSITIDPSGNVWIIQFAPVGSGSTDRALLKISPSGVPLAYYPYPAFIGALNTSGVLIESIMAIGGPQPRNCAGGTPVPSWTPTPTPSPTHTPGAPALVGCLRSGDGGDGPGILAITSNISPYWTMSCDPSSVWVAKDVDGVNTTVSDTVQVTRTFQIPTGTDLTKVSLNFCIVTDDDYFVTMNGNQIAYCHNPGGTSPCGVLGNPATQVSLAALQSTLHWGTNTLVMTATNIYPGWMGMNYSFCYDLTAGIPGAGTPTITPTLTPTQTPLGGGTATQTRTATASVTPGAAGTGTTTPTMTPTPSSTPSPSPGSGFTPVPTPTLTRTLTPVPGPGQPVYCPRSEPRGDQKIVIVPQFGGHCGVRVYRPEGRLCRRVWDGDLGRGQTKVLFWGTEDEAGQHVSSGIYLVVFQDGDGTRHKAKVAIIR